MQEACYTALMISCLNGHINVVMTLINNGAAVNYQSKVVITYTVHCCLLYTSDAADE